MVMKGAPEIILGKCSTYLLKGKEMPIDDAFKESWEKAYKMFARQGERVLGFASLDLGNQKVKYSTKEKNYPEDGLCFIGLVSLMDPPKKGVKEAVHKCKTAGVKVVRISFLLIV